MGVPMPGRKPPGRSGVAEEASWGVCCAEGAEGIGDRAAAGAAGEGAEFLGGGGASLRSSPAATAVLAAESSKPASLSAISFASIRLEKLESDPPEPLAFACLSSAAAFLSSFLLSSAAFLSAASALALSSTSLLALSSSSLLLSSTSLASLSFLTAISLSSLSLAALASAFLASASLAAWTLASSLALTPAAPPSARLRWTAALRAAPWSSEGEEGASLPLTTAGTSAPEESGGGAGSEILGAGSDLVDPPKVRTFPSLSYMSRIIAGMD